MNLHSEMYRQIFALVPKLRALNISKEAYFLQANGQVPVNVWPDAQSAEMTEITMCCYPFDDHRNLVPSPYVEIKLFHGKAAAVPCKYVDAFHDDVQKLEREPDLAPHQELDLTVHSWLSMLQRLNFKFEDPHNIGFGAVCPSGQPAPFHHIYNEAEKDGAGDEFPAPPCV